MLNGLGVTYGLVKGSKLTRVNGRMERQSLFPVIFHTASMFMRTHKKFKDSRVVALVLDNPYALQHELGLTLVGATFTKNSILFSQFTKKDLKDYLVRCRDLSEPLEFERVPYNLTAEVLKDYSASSLSALQTFLYKIKDTDSREFVSKTVKKWMTSDATFDVLEPKLKRYVSLRSIEGLKAIVNTTSMRNFRAAVRKAAAHPNRIARIAKDHKVNAFDIKYLLSTTA